MTEAPVGTGKAYASWIARVGAFIIDVLPFIVVSVVMAAAFGETETTDSSFSIQVTGVAGLVTNLFGLAWLVYNWGFRQGSSGQTIGKKIVGIGVYKTGTTTPLGIGMSIVRYIAHVLDAIPCGIGFLWPLWDKENRTFADMIIDSRVYQV